jgi:hypothetical protein
MPTKMEEKIQKILDDQIDRQIKAMNDNLSGIFIYGIITGIIISYSGVLGPITGFGIGLTVGRKYKHLTYKTVNSIEKIFKKIFVINNNK